jgi:DNA (cytosine-5)-methyltransferase 1
MEVSNDKTATLRAEEHGHQPLVFDASRRHNYQPFGEVCETVQAAYGTGGNNTPMVFENHGQDTRYNELGDVCQTVSATWGMGGNNQPLEVKPQTAVVRRLTPLECERLQGFPDNWTDIGEWTDSQGKVHKPSDSPRYKALGNSICLPFWRWMASRMVAQLKKSGVENPTMASLFDGISGFPLVYLQNGCTPVWTSEIEEYPIAVCKYHFGDEETGAKGDIEKYL